MRVVSSCVRDTLRIGKEIAAGLLPGDLLCLYGDFGSGKTTLVKGIAAGLGIKGENVISPSFVLLREYSQGRLPLFHFDLYRLKGAEEILSIGFEEYLFAGGVVIVEWAEKLKHLAPQDFLKVHLKIAHDTKRELVITHRGKHYAEFLRILHETISH
jgi:tRNA threonylcarbamoyladenosine biosynthesis protein TsaE